MRLSTTVSVHNEEQNIPVFYAKALQVLESIRGLDSWELVFVNNGSSDGTLRELLKLRENDGRVRIVTLSRDFGYHAAVSAGLANGEGDLYAVIDVDGEDPPELLVDFFETVRTGAQIAYGIRSKRLEASALTLMRRLFYLVNKSVADADIVMWMAEFCMMQRAVRDAILTPRTTFPFLRAEIGYVGFRRVGIPYRRQRRWFGKSHYRLWSMAMFAIAGILSSSTFPLRLVLYLAFAVAVAYPLLVLTLKLSFVAAAAVAAITGFYFCLGSISILSLYLARTYKNGVARPIFVVDPENTRL